MAVSLRTRKHSTEPNWEQDLAPQVSKGKPGPANHWPEGSEVTLRQHHKRSTGNTLLAGVVGRRTGAVCESRVTVVTVQSDTELTYGSGHGKRNGTQRNGRKEIIGKDIKLNKMEANEFVAVGTEFKRCQLNSI